FSQHEIGASEIAVFIKIILHCTEFLVTVDFCLVISEESRQSQLFVADVPDDIIIFVKNFDVLCPELLLVECIPVVLNDFKMHMIYRNHNVTHLSTVHHLWPVWPALLR